MVTSIGLMWYLFQHREDEDPAEKENKKVIYLNRHVSSQESFPMMHFLLSPDSPAGAEVTALFLGFNRSTGCERLTRGSRCTSNSHCENTHTHIAHMDPLWHSTIPCHLSLGRNELFMQKQQKEVRK